MFDVSGVVVVFDREGDGREADAAAQEPADGLGDEHGVGVIGEGAVLGGGEVLAGKEDGG